MITVWNKDNGTVCCIDELVLNWGEHISHLYYDQDTEVEMVAFRLIDSIKHYHGTTLREGADILQVFQPTVI